MGLDRYRAAQIPASSNNLGWNFYGPGIENIGRSGRPENFPIPQPSADQLLVRVDAVGLCFSDVKLIKQGGKHPKLHNRDLSTDPTRLGHEAALTVLQAGEDLVREFRPGQRLILQPDIYQNGKSTAYGYTIPGGLIQYHLIGPEVLHGDAGSYLFAITGELGYAEAALTEPWACVLAAYTQRRRLAPKSGGKMWIAGRPGDSTEYQFSKGLEAPDTIVVTDIPSSLLSRIQAETAARPVKLIVHNGLQVSDIGRLGRESEPGFDDIVLLDPRFAAMVSAAVPLLARRGILNIIGREPLDDKPLIDLGRIHYDYTAYVGHRGPDISAAYGPARNRCDLVPEGTALFVGAGGPMGQMHVQRALELPNGPATILATDINTGRLGVLDARFRPLAEKRHRQLLLANTAHQSLVEWVMDSTGGRGADDVLVCVPSAQVMTEAADAMSPDGMLVLFAGVPNGTVGPLNLCNVYLHNAQLTGTSGSTLQDQAAVISSALAGELSPNQSVAAIGGILAAREGIEAMMEGRFPGKIVIYPQIRDLALTSLADLKKIAPRTAGCLAPGDVWTRAAEAALIGSMWNP